MTCSARFVWPRRSRYSTLGTSLSIDFWDALLERHIGGAREVLGADADAVWAEGRALAFKDAVVLALAPEGT